MIKPSTEKSAEINWIEEITLLELGVMGTARAVGLGQLLA